MSIINNTSILFFRLQQHEDALQVSRNRLKTFVDQLNEHIKNKEQLSATIIIKEKQIKQLKITLSNLGVLLIISYILYNI